jgi:hypothetical protein
MSQYRDYAPYYRNGRLYLTAQTVDLLTDAGLDQAVGQAALQHGLSLDEHREHIAHISQTLEYALAQMEEDTQAFKTLSSEETAFLLTGKPSARV